MSEKQKRKMISIQEKCEIIDKCDKSQKKTVVAKECEIPQSFHVVLCYEKQERDSSFNLK